MSENPELAPAVLEELRTALLTETGCSPPQAAGFQPRR